MKGPEIEAGCGMKLQRRDGDKLNFEGGIRDMPITCGILSESQKCTKEPIYVCLDGPWYLSSRGFQRCKAK